MSIVQATKDNRAQRKLSELLNYSNMVIIPPMSAIFMICTQVFIIDE